MGSFSINLICATKSLFELQSEKYEDIRHPKKQTDTIEESHNISEISESYRLEKTKETEKCLLTELESLKDELYLCTKTIRHLRSKIKVHRDLPTIIKQFKLTKEAGKIPVISESLSFHDLNRSIEILNRILDIFLSLHLGRLKLGTVIYGKNISYFLQNIEEGNKWRKNELEKMQYKPDKLS